MSLMVIENGKIVQSLQAPLHNDTLHVTSAKRNVADGVAGLDASAKVPDANLESPVATHAALTASHGQATIEGIAGSQSKVDTHAALATAHTAATNLEKVANKNVASGYAGLDASLRIASAQAALPIFSWDTAKVAGTNYQNGARPRRIEYNATVNVGATAGSNALIELYSDATATPTQEIMTVGTHTAAANHIVLLTLSSIIPPNFYYRIVHTLTGTGTVGKRFWHEVDL